MRKVCLAAILLISATVSFGQPQQVGTRVDKLVKVIPPSPDAASLGKYGDVPVGLFTGVPQISVPLYSFKEGNLEIPINISYHSRGVRVSEVASSVGLGWTLNAGGVITRTVRGKPDESNTGYFYRDARMAPLTIPVPSNPTPQQYISLESLAYNNTDLDPDMFSFSFLGRSGSFFFDHNKNIHLLSHENIKIEVSTDFQSWTIKDESGNKYIFSTIENTTSTTSLDMADPEDFISGWFLTTIITSEGRQVDFYYYPGSAFVQDQMLIESDKYRAVPQVITDPVYSCPSYNGQIQKVVSTQEIYGRKLQRIETGSAILFFEKAPVQRADLYGDYALEYFSVQSKITNAIVRKFKFNYDYFNGAGGNGYSNDITGDKNKRLKLLSLEDITDPGQGAVHKFSYDETPLPRRDSYAQDHWGYYNGAVFNTTLLPQTDGLPYGVPYGDRNSNGTYSSAGVLNKIEYPTGGHTSFTYEPNQSLITETYTNPMNAHVTMTNQPGGTESTQAFTIEVGQWTTVYYQMILGNYPIGNISAQLIITDQNNNEVIHMYGEGNQTFPHFFQAGEYIMKVISPDIPESNLHAEVSYRSGPITQTVNKVVGGIRIKQTADFDPVGGKSIIKKYEYPAAAVLLGLRRNDDYLGNAMEMAPCTAPVCPRYPWQYLEYKCDYLTRSSASNYSVGDISGGHIAYPSTKVIYGQNGENGYSVSTFNYSIPVTGGGFPYSPALVLNTRNGLLLNQKDYNAAGILVKETGNSYEFAEKHNETSLKVGFLYDHPYRDALSDGQFYDEITQVYYNIVAEQVKKVSTSVVQYDADGNNPVSTNSTYYYDNAQLAQPTREETADSKGNLIRIQSTYPHDYPAVPVYTEMLNRNILQPVEQIQTNISLNKQLSHIKTNYQFWNSNAHILPASIQSSVLGALLQTDVTVSSYDDKGNIQEFTGKDGIVNAVIWGYNKQYPVAKVAGKSYNEAISLSGINMTVVNNPFDENVLRTELNKLRNISGAFVTSLTYKPLVGVSSETDAKGFTRYYEYDNQGRLSLIRDQDNKIIKKICYNYAGQPEVCPLAPNPVTYYNVQMNQVFIRNNCPPGQTPGQVTYTVAANTYSSTVSQAAANQLAQNDINANGQAYANANGTCTAFTCSTATCIGVDKKCINNVCETGVRENVSTVYKRGRWICNYRYRWSDGSTSEIYTESNTVPCYMIID